MNLAGRGLLPNFVARSSASLTALKKKTFATKLNAVGEIIWRYPAECITKQASSDSVYLFGAKQTRVVFKDGPESISYATELNFGKIKETKSGYVLRIEFRTTFISVKRVTVSRSNFQVQIYT